MNDEIKLIMPKGNSKFIIIQWMAKGEVLDVRYLRADKFDVMFPWICAQMRDKNTAALFDVKKDSRPAEAEWHPYGENRWVCSKCGTENGYLDGVPRRYLYKTIGVKYCPHCKAVMKEGK